MAQILFVFLLCLVQNQDDGLQEKSHPSMPASPVVDLRPEFAKHQLSIRSQGQRGSCQVFAMVGCIEFQLAKTDQSADLSEQYLMWASNQVSGQHKKTKGFNPDRLFAGLLRMGICLESEMPYVPRDEKIEPPSSAAKTAAQQRLSCSFTSIKHWSRPIGYTKKDLQLLVSKLDAGIPVTSTLCWPEGLTDAKIVDSNNFIVDKNVNGKTKNGHGVVLVGYGLDDGIDGGGYFIVRNSWGVKFADSGYAQISFAYASRYGIDAYIVAIHPAEEAGE